MSAIRTGRIYPRKSSWYWSGPEGSRKLRFPDFMKTAQEGGKVVSHTHRPHLPQEILLVLEWPIGFQEVKVPIFHENSTGRW